MTPTDFRNRKNWNLFKYELPGPRGRIIDQSLAELCRQLQVAGWRCERKARGACYFRSPSGRGIRIADHSPMHIHSMSRISVYMNPKPIL